MLTVVCGLTGFLSGVGVSERPEAVAAGMLPKLYYTLGLFIFGGMDLGTPTGGPMWGRWLLWLAYFVAPIITASAVVEAVLHMIGPETLLLRRMRGHVVVAGCGELTTLYLRRLRVVRPDIPVVVVGSVRELDRFDELRDAYRAQVVTGDITSDVVLKRLRLEHAARILLMAEDDFVNLDAATRILHWAPGIGQRVIVHVSDLRLLRSMAATGLAQRLHAFNGHQIAASHLVQMHLLDHFRRTEHLDVVVLAGFGRFGQTILEELQHGAGGSFDRVVIVDFDATRGAAVFDEQVGFSEGYRREIVDGDLRDPAVWRDVQSRIELVGEEPVFLVGSGDDRINLRLGLWLAQRYPCGLVVARSERRRSFAEAVSREAGFRPFSVAELVTHSMPDAWFGPAGSARDEPRPGESIVAPIELN